MPLDCCVCGESSGLPPKGNAWRDPEDDSGEDMWLVGQLGACASCGSALVVEENGTHVVTAIAGEVV